MMDEFDSSLPKNDEAHIESSVHQSLIKALHEAFDRCEDYLAAKNAGTANKERSDAPSIR
jgi:hypothetical protein